MNKNSKEKDVVRNQNGITLLALSITIVILLILAGITISAVTSKNGIIENTKEAKIQTEVANEKEILEKATIQAMAEDSRGNINKGILQSKLDGDAGIGKTEVEESGDEFEVLFIDSNRYYKIDKDGNIGEMQEIIEDKAPGDITKDVNGNVLDGSENKPYEIWCIEDLVALSNMARGEGVILKNGEAVEINLASSFSGKYIVLKRSLDFLSKFSYANSERTDFGDINGNLEDGNMLINEMTTGKGFIPIIGFSGNFDGKSENEIYKISNIYIQSEGMAGLFAYVSGNVTIKNLDISGTIKGESHTGGIIGEIRNYQNGKCNVINCINRASIVGKNMAGGVVGYIYYDATISQCKNYGVVNMTDHSWAYSGLGGIAGANTATVTIENCENNGTIGEDNVQTPSGGIIGVVNATIEIKNCNNEANILSSSNTGGIVGQYRAGKNIIIYNNSNYGQVIGNSAGGIIGSCNLPSYDSIGDCRIENCYNTIDIEAINYSGGIVGNIGGYAYKEMKIYINNCYNIGKTLGKIQGGIVGRIANNRFGEKAQFLYVNNVYYLIGTSINAVGQGNADDGKISEIKNVNTVEFVDNLNNFVEQNQQQIDLRRWKMGEDGYPIFE